jgi:hypothetical protein
LAVKALNCWIFDFTGAGKCVICKHGYFKNKENYCDTVTVAVCSNFKPPNSYDTGTENKLYINVMFFYLF